MTSHDTSTVVMKQPNHDPEIKLYRPEEDVSDPEATILVPAMDEELTIGTFLEWCREGIANAGCRAEILIVDSSTDRTPEIADSMGAKVVKTPRRGLGRAYIDAIPYVRGRYVIMGDADCTYDFREIAPFIEQLRQGYDFVMGSRFKGSIEPGAMPPLHRYFGTPVTTFILNLIFGSHFSDIHSGMRAITRDALERMDLQSQSWEYAAEMILKSVHMKLKTTEVPINFFKDPEGRQSHMKRGGWLEPWKAGWQNLRAMFTYGVDFFLFKPGLALLAAGLSLMLPLTFGPFSLGPINFSINWMLLAMAVALVGLSFTFFGGVAQLLFDYTGTLRRRWEQLFPYNRTVVLSLALIVAGFALALPLVYKYLANSFRLPAGLGVETYQAVTGLWLIIAGFEAFTFMLLIRAIMVTVAQKAEYDEHRN